MKATKCLIVDDEPLAINIVAGFLARLGIRDPIRCTNSTEALRLLQEQEFDILFVDIRMPKLSGLDIVKTLTRRPFIVITTAYRDFAAEGFDLEVHDYLVKPFSFTRFQQAVEKIHRLMATPKETTSPAEKESLFLKVDRRWVKIPFADILYIESLKDYVRVVTTAGEYICLQSLTDITAGLPPDRFARVHRSFTIAMDRVEEVKHHDAYIRGKAIPLSRAHRSKVLKRLGL